jgi:uncharacterized membrane protein
MNSLRRFDPLITTAISVWVLTMITTPILRWIVGEAALVPMTSVGVVIQAAAVWIILWRGKGMLFAMRSAVLILTLTWLVEFIGSNTGIPFGRYSYTDALRPQLGGVPLIIPLAWLMMLFPSWSVASLVISPRMLSHNLTTRLARAGVAAMAFTAWDLSLDPQMVTWHFWQWVNPGRYFGIPLVNYLGWLVISFTLSFFLLPPHLPDRQLFFVYSITWFLQSFGLAFFWGLPGPAACGFLGMGGMILWSCLRSNNKWKQPTWQ